MQKSFVVKGADIPRHALHSLMLLCVQSVLSNAMEPVCSVFASDMVL